jgi:hypothetical protein
MLLVVRPVVRMAVGLEGEPEGEPVAYVEFIGKGASA